MSQEAEKIAEFYTKVEAKVKDRELAKRIVADFLFPGPRLAELYATVEVEGGGEKNE